MLARIPIIKKLINAPRFREQRASIVAALRRNRPLLEDVRGRDTSFEGFRKIVDKLKVDAPEFRFVLFTEEVGKIWNGIPRAEREACGIPLAFRKTRRRSPSLFSFKSNESIHFPGSNPSIYSLGVLVRRAIESKNATVLIPLIIRHFDGALTLEEVNAIFREERFIDLLKLERRGEEVVCTFSIPNSALNPTVSSIYPMLLELTLDRYTEKLDKTLISVLKRLTFGFGVHVDDSFVQEITNG